MNSIIQRQNFDQQANPLLFGQHLNRKKGTITNNSITPGSLKPKFAGYFDDDDDYGSETKVNQPAQSMPPPPSPDQTPLSPGLEASYTPTRTQQTLSPPEKWEKRHRNFWSDLETRNYNKANKYIRKYGANLVEPNNLNSALMMTILNNDQQLFDELMAYQAEVNHHNRDGYNALTLAIAEGRYGFAEKLLQSRRVDQESMKTPYGESLLKQCLERNLDNVAELLIRNGYDIDEVIDSTNGLTSLIRSIMHDNSSRVEKLLELGADANKPMNGGTTPAHTAANINSSRILNILKQNGANLSALDNDKVSPLSYAATTRSERAFDFLVNNVDNLDNDVKQLNNKKQNILHDLLPNNSNKDDIAPSSFFTTLLDDSNLSASTLKTLVNQVDSDGTTPLLKAANIKDSYLIELFLKHGADINATDSSNNTLFDHLFGMLGAQTSYGSTLGYLSTNNASRILNLLQNHLAKDTIKSMVNTPLQSTYGELPVTAILREHPELIPTMLELGMDPLTENSNEENVIQTATKLRQDNRNKNSYPQVLRQLMGAIPANKKAEIWNQPADEKSQQTIFSYYAQSSSATELLENMKQALNEGADVLAETSNGTNAIDMIWKSKHNENSIEEILNTVLEGVPAEKQKELINRDDANRLTLHSTLGINNPNNSVIKNMIKRGGDVLVTDSNGRNCIDKVWERKNNFNNAAGLISTMMETLSAEQQKELINRNDSNHYTFHGVLSKTKPDLSLTEDMLKRGADLTVNSDSGYSAFYRLFKQALTDKTFVPATINALKNLDKEVAKELVNRKDPDGRTPIMYAAQYLNNDAGAKLASALMEHGADVSYTDKNDNSFQSFFKKHHKEPLTHVLAQQGSHELLQQFINNGADLNETDKNKNTALIKAVQGKSVQTVDLLLKNNADVNKPNKNGITPLMLAVENGDLETTQKLLAAGADLNHRNNDMNSALHILVKTIIKKTDDPNLPKHPQVLDLILQGDFEQKFNLNLKEGSGKTLLHLTVETDNVSLANKLLDAGAKIDEHVGDDEEKTPLMTAVTEGYKDSILNLLERGANPNAELDDDNMLQLMVKTHKRNNLLEPEFLDKVLSTEGLEIDTANSKGITPFMQCLLTRNLDAAVTFLKHGANLKAVIKKGPTEDKNITIEKLLARKHKAPLPFLLNAMNRRDLFDAFLTAGADFKNVRDIEKLLAKIIDDGDSDTVAVLLRHGIDFSKGNVNNLSPLQFAFTKNEEKSGELALQLLKKLGEDADLSKPLPNGNTLIMEATSKGWTDVVNILLNDVKNIDAQHGETGDTLLIQAVNAGDASTVEQLLKLGADINIPNNKGQTALDVAVENDFYGFAASILDKNPDDLNHILSDNRPLLMRALKDKQYDFAQSLIDKGAITISSHKVEGNYATALIEAVNHFDEKGIALLLKNDVKVTVANQPHGLNAIGELFDLMLSTEDASKLKQLDTIGEQLLKAENIDSGPVKQLLPQSMKDKNVLNESMKKGMDKTVQALMNLNVGIEDKIDGKTLLQIAAENSNDGSLQLFINNGADINAKTDNTEETALHLAVRNGHTDAVNVLLADNNIDLEAKDGKNLTAFQATLIEQESDIAKALVNAGCNKTVVADGNKNSLPPMMLTMFNARNKKSVDIEFLKTLVELGVDINEPSNQGLNPLMLAMMSGKPDLIKFFVENGGEKHQVINELRNKFITTYELLILTLRSKDRETSKEIMEAFGMDDPEQLKTMVYVIQHTRRSQKTVDKKFLDNLLKQVQQGKSAKQILSNATGRSAKKAATKSTHKTPPKATTSDSTSAVQAALDSDAKKTAHTLLNKEELIESLKVEKDPTENDSVIETEPEIPETEGNAEAPTKTENSSNETVETEEDTTTQEPVQEQPEPEVIPEADPEALRDSLKGFLDDNT